MARKPLETAFAEWLQTHKDQIEDWSFAGILDALKRSNPDAFKEKKPGRKKSDIGDVFILIDYFEDSILDQLQSVGDLFGDRGAEWAKLAVALIEAGVIASGTPINSLYNFIKDVVKSFPRFVEVEGPDKEGYIHYGPLKCPSENTFYQEMQNIKDEELRYPQEERENDIKQIRKIFNL